MNRCKHDWMRYKIEGMWNDLMLEKAEYPIKNVNEVLAKSDINDISICRKCGICNYIHPVHGLMVVTPFSKEDIKSGVKNTISQAERNYVNEVIDGLR